MFNALFERAGKAQYTVHKFADKAKKKNKIKKIKIPPILWKKK